MADEFQSRLDKVFGALSGASAGWSVSKQIERREWKRSQAESDDDVEECKNRREAEAEDEDEDDENEIKGHRPRRKSSRSEDMDSDMLEIQEIVGMDTTLDSEDEEDEFDQLAAGTQGAGSRLYMKEVGVELGNPSSIPTSLGELKRLPRDCRAYHEAAASRLAEDRIEAEGNKTTGLFKSNRQLDPKVGSVTSSCLMVDGKRKDSRAVSTDKRVRFVDGTKTEREATENEEQPPRSAVPDRSKNLPDHLKSPHKYTHYLLDWSETPENNDSAWRSTMDAVDTGRKQTDDLELPKSIAFVPRAAKRVGPAQVDGAAAPKSGVVIVAMDDGETMSEDASAAAVTTRSSRSYRSRKTESL